MKLSNLIIFAAGVITGSAVTYKLVKDAAFKEASEMADLEVESMRSYFEDKYSKAEEKQAETSENICRDNGYISEEPEEKPKKKKKTTKKAPKKELPYVINPDEFDEFDDYSTGYLTYFANGVLVDDEGNVIDDVFDTVPEDIVNNTEKDCVLYLRDDSRKKDYEVTFESLEYTEPF